MKLRLYTHSTAAKGIANRVGLGKTRHIAVHLLWIQQHLRDHVFELVKVAGTENPADVFTKYVSAEWNQWCMETWNGKFLEGRSEAAPHTVYT